MSRRIETGAKLHGGDSINLSTADSVAQTRDDYLGRLVKYIPTEIVGGYVATLGFVPPPARNKSAGVVMWLVFAGGWIVTPLFLGFAAWEPKAGKGTLWIQVLLGSVAFPVWALALGGPFATLSWYDENRYICSIVLVFVTAIIGFVVPKEGS